MTKRPDQPFIPRGPFAADAGQQKFWFGSSRLWTLLTADGAWLAHPHGERNLYHIKIAWFQEGYNYLNAPGLTITSKRLDAASEPLTSTFANGGRIGEPPDAKDFIASYALVSSAGCWEITGELKGEKLSFVIWVATR